MHNGNYLGSMTRKWKSRDIGGVKEQWRRGKAARRAKTVPRFVLWLVHGKVFVQIALRPF